MGWLKLTDAEKRIILQVAERAKNERFSLFQGRFKNAFLETFKIEITMDPEEIRKELQKPA